MLLQVGVKALVINNKGELLFIRRSDNYHDIAGQWDIPGGRIQPEEQLHEALARELLEETSLKLAGESVLVGAQDIMTRDGQKHVVRLTYAVQATGIVMLSGEHTDHEWLSKDAALTKNIDEYVRELLQRQP